MLEMYIIPCILYIMTPRLHQVCSKLIYLDCCKYRTFPDPAFSFSHQEDNNAKSVHLFTSQRYQHIILAHGIIMVTYSIMRPPY